MDSLLTPVARLSDRKMRRRPRLAFLLLENFDHFVQDLIARLPQVAGHEVKAFHVTTPGSLAAALAWADRPDLDSMWFEFCWPPFPKLVAETDFGGRQIIVRVHRVEAMETNHVANMPWHKVSDLIVVSADMAARVRRAVRGLEQTTRLHLVHSGVDTIRFGPLPDWNRYRIGWCGLMAVRKNPILALQILFSLRLLDRRYHLHVCSRGGEVLANEAFCHLARRLDLLGAIHVDGPLPRAAMAEWHARNGILLHTSLHESFGYAIAEAASTGCDLAVFDFPGSAEFWPDAVLFGTVQEAVRLIRDAAPHRWRHYTAGRFSLDHQLRSLAEILRAPALTAAAD